MGKSVGLAAEKNAAKKEVGQAAEENAAKKEVGLAAEKNAAKKEVGQAAEENAAKKEVRLPAEGNAAKKEVGQAAEENAAKKEVRLPAEGNAAKKEVRLPEEESAVKKEVGLAAEGNASEEEGKPHRAAGGAAKKIKIWVIIGFVIVILFLVKQFFQQKIDSVESLQNYMKSFGIAAPLMLTLFQALQVVVPVLPGYLGCAAGAVAFGTMTGFWCNYIGISLGSIIAYFLAKKYGKSIVLSMFPQKQYEKWSERVERSKSYGWFLFVATLLPLFPDDFLCYFSGLIKMNSKKFIWIIILGKPWCILAYSIGFGLIG